VKLLFVLPEYGPDARGGIATFYRGLLPYLVALGCEVHVCIGLPQDSKERVPADEGITLSWPERSAIKTQFEKLVNLTSFPELRWKLACANACWQLHEGGKGFDLVETTDWGVLYFPWCAAQGGPKVVVQLHGSEAQIAMRDPVEGEELANDITRLLENACFSRADELQGYGRPNVREWSDELAQPINHIWPGWTQSLKPAGAQPPVSDFGLVVGRVQAWKGPDVLCEAQKILGGDAPTILWVGPDATYRRPGQWMAEVTKQNYPTVWGCSVRALGGASAEQALDYQLKAKFVVVPSRWDTFNLTVIESMAAGKVVICSDGAGAAELIENGCNGFVFANGRSDELAQRIRDVIGMSDTERDLMGKIAKETISLRLQPQPIAQKRLDRYRELQASTIVRRTRPLGNGKTFTGCSDPLSSVLNRVAIRDIASYLSRRALARARGLFKGN
jgi:glycosyltransferase involved in cell wall biosynthesis